MNEIDQTHRGYDYLFKSTDFNFRLLSKIKKSKKEIFCKSCSTR